MRKSGKIFNLCAHKSKILPPPSLEEPSFVAVQAARLAKPQVRNYVLKSHGFERAAQVENLATIREKNRRARVRCARRLRRAATPCAAQQTADHGSRPQAPAARARLAVTDVRRSAMRGRRRRAASPAQPYAPRPRGRSSRAWRENQRIMARFSTYAPII